MSAGKQCTDCMFQVTGDAGYSNWTVEETTYGCLLNKHPKLPKIGSYTWETEHTKTMAFASKCDSYSEGKRIELDVDHDEGSKISSYGGEKAAHLIAKVRFNDDINHPDFQKLLWEDYGT